MKAAYEKFKDQVFDPLPVHMQRMPGRYVLGDGSTMVVSCSGAMTKAHPDGLTKESWDKDGVLRVKFGVL